MGTAKIQDEAKFIRLFSKSLLSTYCVCFRHWGYNREHSHFLHVVCSGAGHEKITSEPKIPTLISTRNVTYRV